ncbi:jg5211 [Pararge aegeria aegeria]|uniref:Jg5211 protein n=1 Tax=Pararge aegeria aegeria TaxID=348720 RepID=A0A8S4R0A9_9NEOP|nr:jg5211 [Pararge aegeria aegeria]
MLPEIQSGLRTGYSTATALAKVSDNILCESDKGMGSILVLLDFSRAFDCLNMDLLIAKLLYYGISSTSIKWFSSFLSNRRQYVESESGQGELVQSNVRNINRGTPQGSILSPILFILFTADLVNSIKHCKVHLYADDTQIYYSFDPQHTRTAINLINEDLKAVGDWAKNHGLILNPLKSKFIIFGTKHQRLKVKQNLKPLIVDGKNIERVDCVRNLGLLMDEDLRYAEHVKINNIMWIVLWITY